MTPNAILLATIVNALQRSAQQLYDVAERSGDMRIVTQASIVAAVAEELNKIIRPGGVDDRYEHDDERRS